MAESELVEGKIGRRFAVAVTDRGSNVALGCTAEVGASYALEPKKTFPALGSVWEQIFFRNFIRCFDAASGISVSGQS